MLESKIEKEVCKYAKTLGWEFVKNQGQGNKGKPDRYFLNTNGRVLFVEFKNSEGKVSKLQRRNVKNLIKKGFHAVVIDNIQQGMEYFNLISKIKQF